MHDAAAVYMPRAPEVDQWSTIYW